MNSWVYLFSKFTTEMLLLEAILILALVAGYAGFYTLRKRKLGAIDQTVPSGVVKGYLNDLIVDAQRIQAQLFGLLGPQAGGALAPSPTAGIHTASLMATAGEGGKSPDPALLEQLRTFETKMNEQGKSLQQLLAEKQKLEAELKALREAPAPAAGKSGEPASAAPAGDVSDLQDKIQSLESRLAEYSIIEDDLANLKRLQQENAQLRAALEGKGGIAAIAPAIAAGAVAAASPTPAPAEAAAVETGLETLSAADDSAQPEAATSANAEFEGLVDQVEKSIEAGASEASEPAPVVAEVPVAAEEPAQAAPEQAASTAAPAAASLDNKTDADLVEEFEKMLNA